VGSGERQPRSLRREEGAAAHRPAFSHFGIHAGAPIGKLCRARSVPDSGQLQQETAARRVSMTACVGYCLREYVALRTEMARVVMVPGNPGQRHPGFIHHSSA
jgi:hypothetical protein